MLGSSTSARDRDALPLSAGELVRIARECPALQTDFAQHRDDLGAARGGVEFRAMQRESFPDDPLHRLPRRKRAERILKDDLKIRAQHGFFASAKIAEHAALKLHRAVRDALQTEQRHRERGFPRARFADERHAFARADLEIGAIDGERVAEAHAHILNRKQGLAH